MARTLKPDPVTHDRSSGELKVHLMPVTRVPFETKRERRERLRLLKEAMFKPKPDLSSVLLGLA